MANDNLRQALQQAGLTGEDLAQIVEVDARTVRRWLSGTTPFARQRGKVARALDTTEQQLWPEITIAAPPTASAQPTDLVAGYPTASDLDAPDWKALMRDASAQIELLGDTLHQILERPGVPELLAAKAVAGCEIRIVISQPGPHIAPFLEHSEIAVRVLEGPADQTIYRFDDQLLLILHLVDSDPERAPAFHFRRAGAGGLFDRLTEHYRYLWEDDSQPINPDLVIYNDDQDELVGEDLDVVEQQPPNPETPDRTTDTSAPPPRRWPRRST